MTVGAEAADHGDAIRQAAQAALADVDALGLEGEDRSIMLSALLDVRLRVHAPNMGNAAGSLNQPIVAAPNSLTQPVVVADSDVIGKIASTLKVSRDTLELVYAEQDGEPHVVISSKKIDSGKSAAARQLAQLVAAARQAAGIEEWTSVNVIRAVVSDYGRLDSGNFATSIQQLDQVAVLRGKGQDREVKITKPGLEATADLVKALAGSDS